VENSQSTVDEGASSRPISKSAAAPNKIGADRSAAGSLFISPKSFCSHQEVNDVSRRDIFHLIKIIC